MASVARIVSQGNDKVFTLKMPGNRLFRRLFALNKIARDHDRVLNCLARADLYVIGQHCSTYLRAGANLHIVPED